MTKNKHLFYYAIGPIVGGLFQLAALQILSWLFESTFVGMLSLILIVTNFSLLIFSLGLDQSLAREFHHYENKTLLLINALFPGLIFLIIFLIVLFSFSPDALSYALFNISSFEAGILVASCICFEFCIRFLSLQLRMYEKAFEYSLIQIIPRLVFLFLIVVFFLILDFERDFIFLIYLHTFSVLSALLFSSILNIRITQNFKIQFQKSIFLKLFKFGAPLIISGIAIWGVNSFDKVILRTTEQFDQLALVSIAVTLGYGATFLSSIFNTIWTPLVYKWDAKGMNMKIISEIADYAILLMFLIIFLCIPISWILPYLFPPFYAEIQYLVLGSLYGPFLYTLSEITGVGIALKRKTEYYLIISTFSAVISFLTAWFFVPIWGAKGAFTSIMIAYLSFFILRTHISMKMLLGLNSLKFNIYAIFGFILISGYIYYGQLLPDFAYLFLLGIALIAVKVNVNKIKKIVSTISEKEIFG